MRASAFFLDTQKTSGRLAANLELLVKGLDANTVIDSSSPSIAPSGSTCKNVRCRKSHHLLTSLRSTVKRVIIWSSAMSCASFASGCTENSLSNFIVNNRQDRSDRYFVPGPRLPSPRVGNVCILLENGQVLFIGSTHEESSLLFDPSTQKFTEIPKDTLGQFSIRDDGKLRLGRSIISSTAPDNVRLAVLWKYALPKHLKIQGAAYALVSGNRILIVGGKPPGKSSYSSETILLWDPRTRTEVISGRLQEARMNAACCQLGDGRILITGGYTPSYSRLSTSEIFDPETGRGIEGPPMIYARANHMQVKLHDGRILVIGGETGDGQVAGSARAEIYDPEFKRFIKLPDLSYGPNGAQITPLNSGDVLITGGFPGTSRAERFALRKSAFIVLPHMLEARSGHSSCLLLDGRVLLSGGRKIQGTSTDYSLSSTEMFIGATKVRE